MEDVKVLKPGDDAPGGWAQRADGTKGPWKGDMEWRVCDGPVTFRMVLGRPMSASGVLMPDGSRDKAFRVMPVHEDPEQDWKVRRPDGSWARGRLLRGGGDARFEPQPPNAGEVPAPDGTMRGDMHASSALAALVADDDFAQALYAAMCNVDWCRSDGTGDPWSVSWRGAGGLVAELRRRGEDYMDFYCSGIGTGRVPEGNVRDDVRAALLDLGWEPVSPERAEDFRRQALAMLEEWEAREPDPALVARVGDRAVSVRGGSVLVSRAYLASNQGRVGMGEEWRRFFSLLGAGGELG